MGHERQSAATLESLRARIAAVESARRDSRAALPFGVDVIDMQLPAGGLRLGALHEVAGGGSGAVNGAAAVLFVAGVLARMEGPVLWCLRQRDLFAPALAGVGLHPQRVIYAEAGDEKGVLAVLEDGLRHGGLAAVVGEVGGLAMTPSRRLQLAAEEGGTTAFAVRRWRTPSAAADYGQPTASVSRWRVSALPATREVVAGLMGRPRWLVEMMRCRGAQACEWELEACDEEGHLAVPAELALGSLASGAGRRRTVG
jgi:protein ImuA